MGRCLKVNIILFLSSLFAAVDLDLFVYLFSGVDLTQVLISAGQILTTIPILAFWGLIRRWASVSQTKCSVLQAPPPAICQTSSVADGQSLDQYLAQDLCSGNICCMAK